MAPEKSPAFQFYPKDFLMDGNVQGMSLAERGAYITLLCICWQEQALPNDAVKLSRMLGLPLRAFQKMWPNLQGCFVLTPEGWQHRRLDHERDKQDQYRRRQSDKGTRGAEKRWPKDSHGHAPAIAQAIPEHGSPISYLHTPVLKKREKEISLSPAAPDAFTDSDITQRAGRFLERYQVLYPEHRKGARYALKPVRDYAAAVTLCQTWADDARLDKLAVLFLTTDHKFAEEGSRTVPQFLALASWCDGRLAEWESQQTRSAS